MDILTIGEVLIDLTQTGKDARGIPQFAANPGGAPANLAVAASRLGAQTAFIGKVGADAFGRYLKKVLAENKVDVSGMAVDSDHPTTMAVVSVDATGERDFSFYRSANADVMLCKEDIRTTSNRWALTAPSSFISEAYTYCSSARSLSLSSKPDSRSTCCFLVRPCASAKPVVSCSVSSDPAVIFTRPRYSTSSFFVT